MTKLTPKYKFAVIASDVVIFTVHKGELQVLLIQMKKQPFYKKWAAPGGLVRPKESIDAAAERLLKEKTGVSKVYLEQLYSFGDVGRDPFGRVVSVAYFALVPYLAAKLQTTDEYLNIGWFDVRKLPAMAYDHKAIVEFAVSRLKSKLEYTNIIYSLLPNEFTLGQLQAVYEAILARPLDKRNFRKKILALKLLKKLRKQVKGQANRPAELFSFVSRSPKIVEVL